MAAKSSTSQPKATWQDVEANDAMIKTLCRKYLGAEWEDGAQEVRLHLWKKLHLFRGDAQFKTWMWSVTVNKCLIIIRAAKHNKRLDSLEDKLEEGFEPESNTTDVVSDLYAKETLEQIEMAPLSPKVRQCITQFASGMRVKEIAARQGITIGTAKSYIFRGRQQCRAFLSGKPIPQFHDPKKVIRQSRSMTLAEKQAEMRSRVAAGVTK